MAKLENKYFSLFVISEKSNYPIPWKQIVFLHASTSFVMSKILDVATFTQFWWNYINSLFRELKMQTSTCAVLKITQRYKIVFAAHCHTLHQCRVERWNCWVLKTFVVASMLLHPCSTDRLTKQMAQGNYVRLKTTRNTRAHTHCSVSDDNTGAVVMQVATQSKSK